MAEASTRTVERALNLVAAVCERGSASLAEASREVGLPASTALRLLRTLEASSFLSRDDGGDYRPGSRLIQIGAQAFGKEMLVSLSHQPMEDIVEATGESVYLSIEGHAKTALYIAISEGTHSIRHANWVGRTIPLKGSAAGQVLQDQVPESGYVYTQSGVEEDVTAISAPIRAGGRVVAAMSVLVPTYRIDELKGAQYGQLLLEAAGQVSHGLGENKERTA